MDAKPLFVLIVFVMLIALFASESMKTTDLTPGTPYVPPAGEANFAQDFSYQAGGGPCQGTYTVRQGDTLSQIARTCGVTLEMLLSANPFITNPNLIRPGQVLNIFYVATAVPTLSLPDTGGSALLAEPTALPVQETIPGPELRPGGMVPITIENFPPGTLVNVEIGKEDGPLDFVKRPQISADGRLRIEVPIPPNAVPGETWVVVVTSMEDTSLVVRSPVFTIAP